MAEINVENMEENANLFKEKMGFEHTASGLEMTDDQLVNFLLLCYQGMVMPEGEEGYSEEEEPSSDGKMKVKVMKVNSGDMQGVMDEILGHGN
jgi:hypothetical protein